MLGGHSTRPSNIPSWATEDLVVTGKQTDVLGPESGDRVQLWSIPDGALLRTVDFGASGYWRAAPGHLFAQIEHGEETGRRMELKSWKLPDGQEELLDALSSTELAGISDFVAAPDASGWVVARGSAVSLRSFAGSDPERLLEEFEAAASVAPFGETGVLARDEAGNLRLWSFGEGASTRAWAIRAPAGAERAIPDTAGSRLATFGPNRQSLHLWDLDGLPGSSPLELQRSGSWYLPSFAFHPSGDWCVATLRAHRRLTFWPLARPYPSVVEAYPFPPARKALTFSPDSRWLATGWEGGVRLLPVGGGDPSTMRQIRLPVSRSVADIRFDPEGRFLLVVSSIDAWIAPLDGEPWRQVVPAQERQIESGAISPSGERVATATFFGEGPCSLHVVDVATGDRTSFDLPSPENQGGLPGGVISLDFLDERTLLTMGSGGLRRWDLATGTHELVVEGDGKTCMQPMRASRAAGTAIVWAYGSDLGAAFRRIDLATGSIRPIDGFGDDVESADLDPTGRVVATGSVDGSIRVSRLDGGEPHLLMGHTGNVYNLAISPDLRWVASAGEDGTLRLWPMPDLSKPPLHTLPHDELLATLRSLTNLRAVRDPASDTGWTIELGPFPGWRTVPTW
jgi:WD40 repeat protein